MGQTGRALPWLGMLGAFWNLHTKVWWSSPAREVILKHSADKYLYFQACFISAQPLPLPFWSSLWSGHLPIQGVPNPLIYEAAICIADDLTGVLRKNMMLSSQRDGVGLGIRSAFQSQNVCHESNFYKVLWLHIWHRWIPHRPYQRHCHACYGNTREWDTLPGVSVMIICLEPFISSLYHAGVLQGSLKRGHQFMWNSMYDAAFCKLKALVCDDATFMYFTAISLL